MTNEPGPASRLSADRRALLAQLRGGGAQAARPGSAAAPVPGGGGAGRAPLSVAQEQLWFLDQFAPGLPTYNIGQATLITGHLDRAALRRALDELVRRHDALRTTFAVGDYEPCQVVADPGQAPFTLTDLTGLAQAERETAAIRLVTSEEVERPFSLAKGPLFRARLLVLGAERYVLALTVHHSIADGWSLRLLKRELGELYAAYHAGREPGLAPPPLQYPDYCRWQRSQIASGAFEPQLDYWQRTLAGLPALELPSDRPRPSIATYRGETLTGRFAPGTRSAVSTLARYCEATDFMVLAAGFGALLSRYTQATDIGLGTTVSGRSRPEFADLIGFLVNMVVLRIDTSGDPTFAGLIGRSKAACLDAWAAQDVPFEHVVDRLHPARDPSRNPLFSIAMQLLGADTSGGELALAGTTAVPLELGFGRSRFDLSLSIIDDGGELSVSCEYSTDLFDRSRIRRMFGHLEVLLRAAAAAPAMRISEPCLLTPQERSAITGSWQGPAARRDHRPVHEQIAAVARRQPGHPAVRTGDAELSYGELMRRAGLLARFLRGQGIGREAIVAVALRRGIDVVVAMTGVLAAGAAFVVVDPDHPRKRLEFILKDTGAPVVLTRSELVGLLPAAGAWTPLCLDTDWALIESAGHGPAPEPVDENALAYVLYTSGSTGEPKGVAVEHHALSTFLLWMGGVFDLGPADRILQHMSLIFDFAEGEMFTALTRGATLVFIDEDRRSDPDAFGELLIAENITYIGGPPAVLGRIPAGDYPRLRAMIAGGEAVQAELVNRWAGSGVRFVNGYGPTEAAVGCIFYECEPRRWTGQPPIGRAMPNRVAYVCEPNGNLCPAGIPGEILVGGDGLARGYLNQPELTAERFADDPLRPGARIYRTGDLGMWTEAGQIQFLGRIDLQVKLHGLRIELEEIESVLGRHPAVAAAAVLLRHDPGAEQRLVGYYVPADAASPPTEQELRSRLLDELPAYMIPAAFVVVDALPLTRAGKVDRAALPAPGQEAAAGYVPARSAAERRICQIFSEVLTVPDPGIRASFFELGGNSLRTMQLLGRIGREFGVSVSLRDFYANPTPESVAELLAAGGASAPHTPVVSLRPGGSAPPLYLVPAVSGSPYGYTGFAGHLDGARPVEAFVAPGLDGEREPVRDLGELAAHYLGALLEARPEGPYLLAGWSMGGVVAFELARRLTAQGHSVPMVAVLDAEIPGPAEPPPDEEILAMFVSDLAGLAGLPDPAAGPDPLPGEAGLPAFLASAGLVPPDVTADFVARRFAVFRENARALHRYQPAPYSGRLLVVEADQSPRTWPAWQALACQARLVVVTGNHYSMWAEPGVSAMAAALNEAMVSG
ncbi:MAG TPA: amino acid adenylation domain-containing protein [Streptosporangiaceae bacterium]|nr:amino acid adenylation domain-containing protein [Streptosporangiaceae bacterium]